MQTGSTAARIGHNGGHRERVPAGSSRALLKWIRELHERGLEEEAIASRILGVEPEVILFRTQTLVAIVLDLLSTEPSGQAVRQSVQAGFRSEARQGGSGVPEESIPGPRAG